MLTTGRVKNIPCAPSHDDAFSLTFFDLDKFKPLNNLWGHVEEDEVLRTFAAFLYQLLQPGDIAGQVEGDEFAILVNGHGNSDAVLEGLRLSVEKYNDINRLLLAANQSCHTSI